MDNADSPGEQEQLSILIAILRAYDALMLANADRNPEAAEELRLIHEQGKFVGPPPSLGEDPFGEEE